MIGFGRGRDICHDDTGLLSAFVDGAVDPHTREKVATHLLHCEPCREEVAALRRLRALLAEYPPVDEASALAGRLVGIAGGASTQPLWARPFEAESARRRLPSPRRQQRRAVTGSVLGLFSVFALVVGAGWFAAPPPDAAVLSPVGAARAAFARALAELPTAMDATVAVLMTSPSVQDQLTVAGHPQALPVAPGAGLHLRQVRDLLAASQRARATTTRSGWASVALRRNQQTQVVAEVETLTRPGMGTEVTVVARDGAVVRMVNLPIPESVEQPGLTELSGTTGQRIAGRAATVVDARSGGTLRARWWFDDDSALLLRAEAYELSGGLRATAEYSQITVGGAEFVAHSAPRLYRPSGAVQLSLTDLTTLVTRGWNCDSTLAGLPLVQVGEEAQNKVEATYSDGSTTITVTQQRGTILSAPEGFWWDQAIGAYRNDAVLAVATWQSSDRVFTVVTDGGTDVIATAVGKLPHEAPVLRTRWGRVAAGLQHIWQVVDGG